MNERTNGTGAGPDGGGATGGGAGGDDALARYRAHLARHGVREPGDRVITLGTLGRSTRFALREGQGTRLKALITETGAVTAGAFAEHDWRGLLTSGADAAAIGDALAWLETDESPSPHRMMPARVQALTPGVTPAGVDPGEAALVTAATLTAAPDATTWTGWLLPPGGVPTRWTVRAPTRGAAMISKTSARELMGVGGAAGELGRARAALAEAAVDHLWALEVVGRARDVLSIGAVAKLLASEVEGPLAARALALVGSPEALGELERGLLNSQPLGTRIGAAQELARARAGLVALGAAIKSEGEARVRLELVRALAAHGTAGRPALEVVAKSDADAGVRALAASELGRLR